MDSKQWTNIWLEVTKGKIKEPKMTDIEKLQELLDKLREKDVYILGATREGLELAIDFLSSGFSVDEFIEKEY